MTRLTLFQPHLFCGHSFACAGAYSCRVRAKSNRSEAGPRKCQWVDSKRGHWRRVARVDLCGINGKMRSRSRNEVEGAGDASATIPNSVW